MSKFLTLSASLFIFLGIVEQSNATMVVVNHDEWTLSETGVSYAPTTNVFALNVANEFTGGGSGNFLVYSSNGLIMGSSIESAIEGAGHNVDRTTAITFDLPTLSTYDGLFLALNPALSSSLIDVLIDYVNLGGNVYIAGGTGVGGAAYEAAAWNPFLNAFGFEFSSPYNGIGGALPADSASADPLFDGVESLYFNNGNYLALSLPTNPLAEIALYNSQQQPLIGVYRGEAVPEPTSLLLLGAGTALFIRKRKQAVA